MEEMFKGGKVAVYAKGDAVPLGSDVHFIRSGVLAVYSHFPRQKKTNRLLLIRLSGEIFPVRTPQKNSLYSGRTLHYKVLKTLSVVTISRQKFDQAIRSGKYGTEMFNTLTNMMSVQGDQIDSLLSTQTMQRLLERLYYFGMRLGVKSGGRIIIDVPMTHGEIAESISTTRETVNRFMRELEQKGIISVRRQTVIIESEKALIDLIRAEKV
ncbi:MAG: transcriptional regulator, Crp/Fnr family [Candidatus Saccharibacteria bacterium]|nr:transcriptional regulator, Crp/Fnr family [Candidatus Saccharibacteria bacterium]